ncbi:MAG: hypothetical protein J6D29_05815 [Solobacterium sp.]|nr:hypothetical protein [Solobacterium sp.]
MKIKIGPVEVEQDEINDATLFDKYQESPKEVEKYLVEKSRFYDLTLRNIIAGRTTRMVRDAIFTIIGGVFFTGWSLYVFYISKDAFEWQGMTLTTAISILLQALLVMGICFLPVVLIGGFLKILKYFSSKK